MVRSFGLSACRVITLRPAMYVPGSYRAPNAEAAVEIIAANPWAVLVGCTDEARLASHIPVILDRERRARRDAARTSRASESTFEAAEPERPIFEN